MPRLSGRSPCAAATRDPATRTNCSWPGGVETRGIATEVVKLSTHPPNRSHRLSRRARRLVEVRRNVDHWLLHRSNLELHRHRPSSVLDLEGWHSYCETCQHSKDARAHKRAKKKLNMIRPELFKHSPIVTVIHLVALALTI